MNRFTCLIVFLCWLCLSCKDSNNPKDNLFQLLSSEETGIDFSNNLTSTDELNILEYLYFYNGGGVALGDINNDGLVDIYFTSNQGSNKLYLNKGNFQFEDITDTAGVDGDGGWSTGVTMADINGDGFLDIYVCQVGDYKGLKGSNKLYFNNGDLTFTESAADFGLDFVGFSTHAVFFDYDQDGDLDMYLLNHSIKKPEVFSHADTKFENVDEKGGDKLFKNMLVEGESVFVDVTAEAGILSSSLGFGLGVGVEDVNGDGWLDIYVSNDFTEDDYLYINNQDGTFTESLGTYIANTSRYSMGNDLADINNDGLPDIFTTDMLPEDPTIWMKSVGEDRQEVFDIKKRLGYKDQYVRNHLQLNRGDGRFSEIALLTNTFATDWSWAPLIFDMDNDGYKDIHVTNGIVKRPNDLDFIQYSQTPTPHLTAKEKEAQQIEMLPSVKIPNYTYRNLGGLQFEEVAKAWGLNQSSYSNGSAYADLDNDGDLDLVVNNSDQLSFIYRNDAQKLENNFIQLDLKGKDFNPFGIGAIVSVYAMGELFQQTLSTSRGFQSGPSTTLTFGLGVRDKIDSIIVSWSAKEVEKFSSVAINTKHILEAGKGSKIKRPSTNKTALLSTAPIKLGWKHEENTGFDEFRREYLMPRRYATEGPAVAVGDVNGDGLDDVFLGGARLQAGNLFLQQQDGSFKASNERLLDQFKPAEDVIAAFVDLNGDGHLDLFVGSGGNEFKSGMLFNFDRIYFNDGKGNFSFSVNSLPPIGENASAVAFADVNGDSYVDIFLAASVVAGNYGAAPPAYLLLNDGKGKFRDATAQYFGENFRPGMVQSAEWIEVDGQLTLVLAGEWMPVLGYSLGDQGKFTARELAPAGWYTGLRSIDFPEKQLLLGNLGFNSKLKASEQKPLWLYHVDMDGNSQEDPLIFHYMKDLLVPFATRDDLIKQVPAIKRKHESYVSYAKISQPKDILSAEIEQAAKKMKVTNLSSGYISLMNGEPMLQEFPLEVQFSPVRDFLSFHHDGEYYLLVAGNFYGFRNDLGRADAQALSLLKWEQQQWVTQPISMPANTYWGEYRKLDLITIQGKPTILAVRNNERPLFFQLKP